MKDFTINTCRSLINESGSLHRIAEICRQQGIFHPLIVTDAGIQRLGVLDRVETYLRAAGLQFHSFTDVIPDPPDTVILDAVAAGKAHAVDGVIGLGGGSSLDTAKLVALLARSGGALESLYGVNLAKGSRLPLILIPTTAGTGSEVTAVAIVTTGKTTKQGIVANQLFADVALLDAELTLALPASITAMTGVDAMVHAVEAYTSIHKKNVYTDMLAKEALRLLSQNIVTATHEGSNIEARQAMLLGACMAGQAFANAPVAAVHALAYPLGGNYHLPHGLTNSLVLPHVLRFNAPHAEQAYAELAEIVIAPDQLQRDVASRCAQFIDYFPSLIDNLELPSTLSDVDVPESELPMLAAEAMLQQRLLVNNPRPLQEQDALAIYQAAFR